MKKITMSLFLLCLSIMLTLFSYGNINAMALQTETIYPENIVDYTDLTNISSFDIGQEYIAYTLDKKSVILFEKSTRTYTSFDNFSNITKIKLTNNALIIVDDAVYVIKNFDKNNKITLSDINLDGIKALDIYNDDNSILIGLVNSSSFKLYKYNLDFVSTAPVQTISPTSISFADAFEMSINSQSAYIISKTSVVADKYTTSLCKIFHTGNTNNNNVQIFDKFQANAKVIESFVWNNNEYIATFTNEILFLLSSENEKLAEINISTPGNLQNSIFPIFEITDLQFFDNKIYISDSNYKTIQSASINILEDNTYSLKCDEIILGSFGFDYGRFNQATDIYIQGDTYLVSDSANNRIHILKNNISSFINIPSNANNPQYLTIDSKQNIFVSVVVDSKIQILKYAFNNGDYTLSQTYDKFNGTQIENISDMCSDNSDNVYILANNQVLYLSEDMLISMENINLSSLDVNSASQIAFICEKKLFAITSNNDIYFFGTDGTLYTQTTIENLKEITADQDKLFAISDNLLYTIELNDNLASTVHEEFISENYSHFNWDIIKRKMLSFDNNRSCLTFLQCGDSKSSFDFEDISNSIALDTSSTIIPLKTNNSLIYEYPYELGNIYNIDGQISNAIGISQYGEYYRIIFAYEEQLKIGFVKINNTSIISYNYNTLNVITTNQSVPVYKYPTLLTYENNRLITNYFGINKKLTLLYKYPISIDGKTFYTYQEGNNIGFIFEADIVLYSSKTISNLITENASIHLIGKDSTHLLNEDLTTNIRTLKDNDRIYVEKFDKNSTYTKVIIKDINLNTFEGYVLTSDIQMDELDNSKIILIIIIIVSIVLLALIIVSYIIIKKKNK